MDHNIILQNKKQIMKKIYKIVVHIRPWEIDQFEYQLKQLIKNSYYIEDTLVLYVNMDISENVIDYNNSNIKKDYFISKFKHLEELTNKYYIAKFNIVNNLQVLSTRRQSVKENDCDYIIWLDSDIYFNSYTLLYLINSSKLIKESKFILTPNIIKYWDSSWDCITAKEYLSMPYNHRDFFDSYSIDNTSKEEISISKNHTVKLGAGWFNLFSNELLQEIKIPDSFGGYGPDDTYIEIIAAQLQYPQYIVNGCVVTELGKFIGELPNFNYIKDNLVFFEYEEKVRPSKEIMFQEIQKFLNNRVNEL